MAIDKKKNWCFSLYFELNTLIFLTSFEFYMVIKKMISSLIFIVKCVTFTKKSLLIIINKVVR